jgi:hypothetical protein
MEPAVEPGEIPAEAFEGFGELAAMGLEVSQPSREIAECTA